MADNPTDADDEKVTLMRLFAKLRMKHGTCGRAASEMFPGDFPTAANYVRDHENHPFVLAEMRRLAAEEPVAAQLPTKDELAKKLVMIGDNESHAVQMRLSAYKMYAEVMGYTTKPGMGGAVNAYQNNVMETVRYENESAWEAAARRQQESLAAAGNAPTTDTTH